MTETALHYLSLTEVSERLRKRSLSPVEVTAALIERIERHDDGDISSFITTLPERAMARARQAEEEIGRGLWRGPLHGVPIAVKDLCDTDFAPSTGGMAVHADFIPERNSTVVERLEAAGAIILGKLAMTEGAFAAHHPTMPTPLNPWSREHWPGMSSSGSGAATAAGFCFASLGSDTGGSIRLPSSACGLTGLKPTWGRVSRAGIFPLAESLDHVGPMTRNAADAAAVLGIIAGVDPRDPTSLGAAVPDYLAGIAGSISGVRLGVDMDFIGHGTDPQIVATIDAAIATLEGCGALRRNVVMPPFETMLEGWMNLCAVEAAVTHRHSYPAQAPLYGAALSFLLDLGAKVSGMDIAAVNIARLDFAGAFEKLFGDVDLMIMPVSPKLAPTAAEALDIMGGKMSEMGRFTATLNMTGHPTITLQGGFDQAGVPIGFQLVGRHLDEALLLRAGHAFQQRTDWHVRHPVL